LLSNLSVFITTTAKQNPALGAKRYHKGITKISQRYHKGCQVLIHVKRIWIANSSRKLIKRISSSYLQKTRFICSAGVKSVYALLHRTTVSW